ncbi:N-6 DNA methylase [Haloferula sp. A504]|uniref:N-6 DNA methylase n=1 Tax=Haloferula sp. A504 TaxID=3373601 RepID=UPI0031CA66E4|nr:N-6 DNA methylase [Verrucomicrobiaceae bacterium E54]
MSEELPEGWTMCKVSELLADVSSGFACGTHNQDRTGIGHLRPMNVSEKGEIDLSVLKSIPLDKLKRVVGLGDILFNNTNSPRLVGKTSWINSSEADGLGFSNHMTRLRAHSGILPGFLARQLHLRWQNGCFRSLCNNHVNQASLQPAVFDEIEVGLPPTDEQKRILSELEPALAKIDEAEEALERVRGNLERYRASVLKAACEGRLVPTEAELAREEGRDFEHASDLLKRILVARRQAWEKAQLEAYEKKGKKPPKNWKERYKEPQEPDVEGLPDLPEGWCWTSVEQLTQGGRPCAYGILQPGPDVVDGVPMVRIGDIREGRVHVNAIKKVAPEVAAEFPRTRLSGGEVAISLVGAIGRTAVIPECLKGGNTARAVGIIPVAPKCESKWIDFWLRSPAHNYALAHEAKEVARKTLNLESVRAFPIALPPRAEQIRAGVEIERLDSLVDEIEAVTLSRIKHCHALLETDGGRAGVVLPDNVLFEGGGGESLRRQLLKSCEVHTLLRLPTGIFYKPGVKANVLFFDKKPGSAKVQTRKLWVYDLRTNKHFTLKQKPITLADFDEFLGCYRPGSRHRRKATWSPDNPEGRWRCYDWAELEKRDKLDLDLSWLKDESIDDGSDLPEPDELAEDMIRDLQNALELLTEVSQVVTKRPS